MTGYKTFDIGFVNTHGEADETQLDIEESTCFEREAVELINLILSLKEEMEIDEVTYIEQVFEEEE